MPILAATDFSTRSNRALRQAGLLEPFCGAELHVVHVVDDDQPEELVRVEKGEAERLMAEQMASMPELAGIQCRPMVITGDPFDGILRAAAQVSADLIVMGTHRKQLLRDIFVGTTIERVIRKGTFPVLMVNHDAQRNYRNVLAPVDMSDASANALRIGLSTRLIGNNAATLLHAYLAMAKGRMFVDGVDPATIDQYVSDERRTAMDELAAFLVANDLDRVQWSFRLEQGGPMETISRAVAEMHPDLLVMGTHGRSGLLKTLIGSVTEEALRSLHVDILVVPPAQR